MKRVIEVDIIRIIAILLVVFTHCFAIYIGDWTNPNPNVVKSIFPYILLTDFLSAFRMPAVVLVAGYIFAYFNKKEPLQFNTFFIKKFKRLIIPSYIFGIIYLLLFRDYNLNKFIITLLEGPGHLWFLQMIFLCFIIGFFLIRKRGYRNELIIFISLFILSFCSIISPKILGLSKFLYFIQYYYLGILFWNYRDLIIQKVLSKKNILLLASIFLALFSLISFINYFIDTSNTIKFIILFLDKILKYAGVSLFYIIVMFLVYIKKIKIPDFFKTFNKYTYGIYIYHQFILMYIIYKLDIYKYLNEYIAPFLYFIIIFFTSLFLTKLFLKTRIGKYLIG